MVQRFHTAATIERDGIRYEFVTDKHPPWLSTRGAPPPFITAIVKEAPDVVHVNGLIFPQLVAAIRGKAAPRTAIVAQHHGGEFPIRGSGLSGIWLRRRWHRGLAAADALSFTAAEQAEPWRAAGVLADQRVIEIVEASTTMRAVSRERARTAIAMDRIAADPVGRQADHEQGSADGARRPRARVAAAAGRAGADGVRRRHVDRKRRRARARARRCCSTG